MSWKYVSSSQDQSCLNPPNTKERSSDASLMISFRKHRTVLHEKKELRCFLNDLLWETPDRPLWEEGAHSVPQFLAAAVFIATLHHFHPVALTVIHKYEDRRMSSLWQHYIYLFIFIFHFQTDIKVISYIISEITFLWQHDQIHQTKYLQRFLEKIYWTSETGVFITAECQSARLLLSERLTAPESNTPCHCNSCPQI